jgi:hypothetical protein
MHQEVTLRLHEHPRVVLHRVASPDLPLPQTLNALHWLQTFRTRHVPLTDREEQASVG